jgi:hypothetical protein
MKYFLPAIVAMMGCAGHQSFDSHDAAVNQDNCFQGDTKACRNEKRFDAYMEAQVKISCTNLTIRHDLIRGNTARALKCTDRLERDGYWDEGPSYYFYTKAAYDWAKIPMPNSGTIEWHYSLIAGPDSQIPLAETRATTKVAPQHQAYYHDAHYSCWRTDSTYILIPTDTAWPLRKNTHTRPSGPSYWHSGKWAVRPEPYTGYDAGEQVLDECSRGNDLPCGIFGPLWRLSPPKVTVLRNDTDLVVIRYQGLKTVTRTYIISGGHLTWGEE